MRNEDGTHIDDAREREWLPGQPGALSEEAPSEPAGPAPVVGSGGVVGLRVESAMFLIKFWETRAEARKVCDLPDSAYAFQSCADDLRRQMGLPVQRQPEPNTEDDTRPRHP